jgi:hypothetical protein
VQPATSPNVQDDLGSGGTEYFLSVLQLGTLPTDNRVAAREIRRAGDLCGIIQL